MKNEQIPEIVAVQRKFFRTGATLPVKWRIQQRCGPFRHGRLPRCLEFREFTHAQTLLKGRTVFNLPLRKHPCTGKACEWKMKLLKWSER